MWLQLGFAPQCLWRSQMQSLQLISMSSVHLAVSIPSSQLSSWTLQRRSPKKISTRTCHRYAEARSSSTSYLLFAIAFTRLYIPLLLAACAFNRVTIVQGAPLYSSRFRQEEHASMCQLLFFYAAIRAIKYASSSFCVCRAFSSSSLTPSFFPPPSLTRN